MLRRTFLGCWATYPVAVTIAHAQPRRSGAAARAISTLQTTKRLEASGDFDKLTASYHSDAIVMEPATVAPHIGRAAIVQAARSRVSGRKLLYLYYQQPEVLVVGNSALVISNYEAGYQSEGQTVEETGKSSNVIMLGPNPPLVALDALVPNFSGGASYGSLGTPLAPHFGVFPVRALGPAPTAAATSAGGGENDELYKLVREINNLWVTGKGNDILSRANRSGVFLIGDYSPFYITGVDDIRQHFEDFNRTSKVMVLRELDPTVRIWGDTAAVVFNFDLDYTLGGRKRRSPGRAVYTFVRGGAPNLRWGMAACAASHLVLRNIGDPYPTAAD